MSSGYDKFFKTGDCLLLELISNDIFEGIYVGGGKDRITICETVQYNRKLGGIYEFYRNEISKVYYLKELDLSKEEIEKEESQLEANYRFVRVSENEYYRLKEISKNFIYIENADNGYFKAVEALTEARTVGVVALGMTEKRSEIIELLVLCTSKQVYIFDLANVQSRQLYPELKEIFESEYVCKVIHKSGGLVDILRRYYNVNMQNIFDTQIVDLIFQKKETSASPTNGRDISECLEHYLHFPKSLLYNASSVSNKQWKEKPLSEKMKFYASQLSTYLLLLKTNFENSMLEHVYNTIENVLDRVYDMEDFKFFSYSTKKEVPKEIQKLIPNLAELTVKCKHSKNSAIDKE